MRKTFLFVLALGTWFIWSSTASASLTTSLLTSYNVQDKDDTLADNSLGFIFDADGSGTINAGDEAFGIARVDNINDDPQSQGYVYIIYSLAFGTPVNALDPTQGWSYTANAGTHSLSTLLGGPVGAGSLAAVVEWDGTQNTNPFLSYTFGTGFLNNPGAFLGDIATLMGNSTMQFAVGLVDQDGVAPPDDYFTSGVITAYLGGQYQMGFYGAMSVTDNGVLNPALIKGLVLDPNYASATQGGNQYLKSLVYGVTIDPNNPNPMAGFIATRDTGDYSVNYVPEPASIMALIGLGLAGLAMSLVRRRKS